MSENNIFSNWWNGFQKNKAAVAYDDEGDMISICIRYGRVLLLICALVLGMFGIYYHYNIFEPVVGGVASVIFAGLYMVFLELIVIMLGFLLLREILTGVWAKSVLHVIKVIGFIAVWGVSFSKSLNISITCTGEILRIKIKEMGDTTAVFSPEIAALKASLGKTDSMIAISKTTVNAGEAAKWKGKTTERGQEIAASGSALAGKAFDERSRLLKEIEIKEGRMHLLADSKIAVVVQGIAQYGVHMEWAKVLFILIISIGLKIRHDRELAGSNENQPVTPQPQLIQQPAPQPIQQPAPQPIQQRPEAIAPPPPTAPDFRNFSDMLPQRQWDLIFGRPTSDRYSMQQLHAAAKIISTGFWQQAEQLAPNINLPQAATNIQDSDIPADELVDVAPPPQQVNESIEVILRATEPSVVPPGCVKFLRSDGQWEILNTPALKSKVKRYHQQYETLGAKGLVMYDRLMALWKSIGKTEADLN